MPWIRVPGLVSCTSRVRRWEGPTPAQVLDILLLPVNLTTPEIALV